MEFGTLVLLMADKKLKMEKLKNEKSK